MADSDKRGAGLAAVLITAVVGPLVVWWVTQGPHGADPGPKPTGTATSATPATPATSAAMTLPPTPDEVAAWVKSANAYCREADAVVKQAGQVSTPEDIPAVLPTLAQVFRTMDSHLRGMSAPARISGQVLAMTQQWDQVAMEWDQEVQAYQVGDATAVNAAAAAATASNATGNGLAIGLGLTVCADVGGVG